MFRYKYILSTILVCIVFSHFPVLVKAEQFGRFFTTPEQRKDLEEYRKTAAMKVAEVPVADDFIVEEDEPAVDAEPLDNIQLQGLVYRDRQKKTVWLNNTNMNDAAAAMGHLLIEEDNIGKNNVTVRLLGWKQEYNLKVGQSLDPNSESISDMFVYQSAKSKK